MKASTAKKKFGCVDFKKPPQPKVFFGCVDFEKPPQPKVFFGCGKVIISFWLWKMYGLRKVIKLGTSIVLKFK